MEHKALSKSQAEAASLETFISLREADRFS